MTYINQHILKTHSQASFDKFHPFDWHLIVLTSFLVRIDGSYSFFEKNKIDKTFKHFFTPNQQKTATEAIEKVVTINIDWAELINEIILITQESDRLQLLTFLFEISCTDGSLSDKELTFIHQLSLDFKIEELTFLKLLEKYKMWNKTFRTKEIDKLNSSIQNSQQNIKLRALTIFGLFPNASEIDIKKRYRELMKKHHPDANPHLSPEELVFNRNQIYKINQAYEILLNKN